MHTCVLFSLSHLVCYLLWPAALSGISSCVSPEKLPSGDESAQSTSNVLGVESCVLVGLKLKPSNAEATIVKPLMGVVQNATKGSVQHNPLPRCKLQVNLAKKWQSGKQNKTLNCPARQVMFWAESSRCNSPLFN